jgi:RuvB-like protein 1 (pontin 52)
MEEIIQIAALRAAIESLSIESDALVALGHIGAKTSLRHAIQLLTPASIVAHAQGLQSVDKASLEEASSLFLDAKRSAQLIRDNNGYLV